MSWLIWEDKKTILSIPYVRIKGDAYPLITRPVGSINTTEYIDRNPYIQLEKSIKQEEEMKHKKKTK
jgi:hypothetical protein